MTTLEYIVGGVLLLLALVLIFVIGKQQSKRHGLGNSIAGTGASDSYLAKNKIGNKDKSYQKITLVIAILFVVLTIALYVIGTVPESSETTSNAAATSETSAAAE